MSISAPPNYVCTQDLNRNKHAFYGYTTTLSFNLIIHLLNSDDFDSKRPNNEIKYDRRREEADK